MSYVPKSQLAILYCEYATANFIIQQESMLHAVSDSITSIRQDCTSLARPLHNYYEVRLIVI